MLSRFGGEGQGWDRGLEGMGIHPTIWPDSERDGFQWNLKGTTVRTHDWYRISSLLDLPEKAALCTQNLVPDLTDPPTLSITYLSASGGPLALPPFCALGFGWPRWGLGVEGMNARVGGWLLSRIASSSQSAKEEKDRWSVHSDESNARLLGIHADDEPKRPVRGWVFMDYFAEPDGGLVSLLVENNFIGR
ncbi:PLC-like phosphodiesterase [Ceratobasidium sp. AG-Ba]|nr:PLC-like phosphodiesterase [Ceratobasidium sp. AG-Ba]QRW15281.1 PLC-like phosphodiesterase [Ceratobasidium sp. AG-Ba]